MIHPVLCIPKIHPAVTNAHIVDTIQSIGLGDIEKYYINEVSYHKTKCKKVYVYFKQWNHTPWIKALRMQLLNGGHFKIFYDKPRYWICSATRQP